MRNVVLRAKNGGIIGTEFEWGANPQWHSRFVQVFNPETFIEFPDQPVRYYRGTKIHPIADNAAYHRSPMVREWMKGKEHLMECHFLPANSPKPNAVE